ncbi:MAG: hypothetical protein AB8F78_20020 [Saprospiraceae bacterium]
MSKFTLEQVQEFDDEEEDAVFRVRSLSKNGRNDFNSFRKKAQKDGSGTDIERFLRSLDDFRMGLSLPPNRFKKLGTRKETGSRVHEGEHEFKIGQLRIYCVKVNDTLIICFSGHTKKGKGTKTDQVDEINSFRARLREINQPLADLPDN